MIQSRCVSIRGTRGLNHLAPTLALIAGLGAGVAYAGGVGSNERGLRSFAVPGSDALITLWEEHDAQGATVPYAAISLDGRGIDIERPLDHRIMLKFAQFDPLVGEPHIPADLRAGAENRAFIVQFETPILDPYLATLTDLGVRPHIFLGWQAFIVEMDPALVEEVEQQPFVRWVGAFHPAYKIDPLLLGDLYPAEYLRAVCAQHGRIEFAPVEALAANLGEAGEEFIEYSIMVFERGPVQQNRVAQRVEQIGGHVVQTIPEGFRVIAMLTPAMAHQILQMDEVLFIDIPGPNETDMDIARIISGANYIETTLGFTGQGVRGEVCDDGLFTSHVDFQSPPALWHGTSGSGSHGTSTYGIVFGTGTANSQGRGLLPNAEAKIISRWTFSPNRYVHTQRLVDPSGPYRAVFQTNSWGAARTRAYTTISAEMDDITFLHDITILNSQSNAGNQDSRPQAWAKNIVAVGGVRHYNTLTKNDDCWCSGASIGPAADGRTKPELTHFYDNIFTTSSSCSTCYTSTFGGTSGATPITAGYFGLMFQMWHERVFDGFGGGNSVFESRPAAATARALMINSADQYPFSSPSADLSRYKQGWGMVDVRRLYDRRDLTFIIDESELLRPLQTHQYRVSVPSGQPEFKASLVYKDLRGNPSSQIARINKINLRATSPNNTVYWGNNGLNNGNYSTSGGSANNVDTAENVFVANPMAGEWLIEIIGTDIVQDAWPGTPEVDAAYALAVFPAEPRAAFTLAASGTCPGTVRIDWSGAPAGRTMGLLFARGTGSAQIPPNSPCAGTVLGLNSNQLQLVDTFGSGSNGSGNRSGQAGSAACGGHLQLIVSGSCETSTVARIP